MNQNSEVIIVGGGLAGLIAALHLSNHNIKVILIEKNEYPRHKVCGEYISNEVLSYLSQLNLDVQSLKPIEIQKLEFSLNSGRKINSDLPLGGFGISRYTLDNFLFEEAKKRGCTVLQHTVEEILFDNDAFTVTTKEGVFSSAVVIGAFGKRSNLDVKFKRNFIQKKAPWLGVKAHYKTTFPDNLVGLHHFKGGYCGVSKVENNLVNICYLANYETFKKYKSIEDYQEKVLCQNPNLKLIFQNATLQFEKPITISQVSFEEKKCVENHIIMIGDTAGLIHPLCGNGMAMAIHSAKLASEQCIDFLKNKISRTELEHKYTKQWNFNFKNRLKTGRLLGTLLQNEKLAQILLKIVIIFPFMLQIIIKKTHGKPL